jgi:glycosyltransferase involved in cell wall biosynthesis
MGRGARAMDRMDCGRQGAWLSGRLFRTVPRLGEPDPPRCLHIFPSFGQGGTEIQISSIINHLGPKYQQSVVSLDGNTDCTRRLDPANNVIVNVPRIKIRNPVTKLSNIWRVLGVEQPDLLFTYNWGAIEWALVNRIGRFCPQIHFETGFNPEEADASLQTRVVVRRLALNRADRIVVPSRTLRQLITTKWKLDAGRVAHIPNGVDCHRYPEWADAASVPGFVKQKDELILGTVAPLRAIKNIFRLIRAFSKVECQSKLRLLIVGDGTERAKLVAEVSKLGLADRVFFAGHLDKPEAAFALIDVFAVSSDSEQMPFSVLQAMASSRAVASTDVGDISVMVADANRPFIVPKEDEVAFARAISVLLNDPALRTRLGALNRNRAQNEFPEERMFAAYRSLIEVLIARPRNNR